MTQTTGGCLCGEVRIVATGEPYRVGLCHCLDCRKNSGSLFQALNRIVPGWERRLLSDPPATGTDLLAEGCR